MKQIRVNNQKINEQKILNKKYVEFIKQYNT